jgi:hypothetical protein
MTFKEGGDDVHNFTTMVNLVDSDGDDFKIITPERGKAAALTDDEYATMVHMDGWIENFNTDVMAKWRKKNGLVNNAGPSVVNPTREEAAVVIDMSDDDIPF